jgi:hypothetical protein
VVRRHGGILHTCDSVQCWETTDGASLLGGLMARALGFRGRACVGPAWRKACEPKEGPGFRPAFQQLLDYDFRHLVSGHGAPLRGSAKDDLHRAVRKVYG